MTTPACVSPITVTKPYLLPTELPIPVIMSWAFVSTKNKRVLDYSEQGLSRDCIRLGAIRVNMEAVQLIDCSKQLNS